MTEKEMNEIVAENIKRYMNARNLTQLDVADALGVHQTSVSSWCMGKKLPRMDKIDKLCELFNVRRSELLYSPNELSKERRVQGVRIPVLGTVHAGIPIDAVQDIIDYEEITPQLASSGDFFALQIKGDCMTPKITEGDVIIVRCQNDANNGDIVVATVNGEEAVVRKLQKYENGIALIPINPSYEPIRFTNEEIETLPVEIIGKAVELRAKL